MVVNKSFEFKNTDEILSPREHIHAQDLYGMIGLIRGFGIRSGCGITRATNLITVATGSLLINGTTIAYTDIGGITVDDTGMSAGQHRWTNVHITPGGLIGKTDGTAVDAGTGYPIKPTDLTNIVMCSTLKIHGTDLVDEGIRSSVLDLQTSDAILSGVDAINIDSVSPSLNWTSESDVIFSTNAGINFRIDENNSGSNTFSIFSGTNIEITKINEDGSFEWRDTATAERVNRLFISGQIGYIDIGSDMTSLKIRDAAGAGFTSMSDVMEFNSTAIRSYINHDFDNGIDVAGTIAGDSILTITSATPRIRAVDTNASETAYMGADNNLTYMGAESDNAFHIMQNNVGRMIFAPAGASITSVIDHLFTADVKFLNSGGADPFFSDSGSASSIVDFTGEMRFTTGLDVNGILMNDGLKINFGSSRDIALQFDGGDFRIDMDETDAGADSIKRTRVQNVETNFDSTAGIQLDSNQYFGDTTNYSVYSRFDTAVGAADAYLSIYAPNSGAANGTEVARWRSSNLTSMVNHNFDVGIDVTGDANFAGGTTYKVEADGDVIFKNITLGSGDAFFTNTTEDIFYRVPTSKIHGFQINSAAVLSIAADQLTYGQQIGEKRMVISSVDDNAFLRIHADTGGTASPTNRDPVLEFYSDGVNVGIIRLDMDVDTMDFEGASEYFFDNNIEVSGTVDGVDIATRDHAEVHTSMAQDTTPQLGGDLDLNSNGITAELTCGATIAIGDLCYLSSTSDFRMELAADNSSPDPTGLLGIALDSGTNGQVRTFLLYGIYTESSIFSAGELYYISSTAGRVDHTAIPATTGDIVRVIGYGLTTTTMMFNPSSSWVEVA